MQGFIDRITDGVAVILLDGGGRAYVPADGLPAGLDAGDLVEVSFAPAPSPEGPNAVEEVAALIERLRAGGHRHHTDHG
jgi:hypothetical protein